jgi:hypothetical protein
MFTFSSFENSWSITCNSVQLMTGTLREVDDFAGRLVSAGLMPRETFDAFRNGAGIHHSLMFGTTYPDSEPSDDGSWSLWVD